MFLATKFAVMRGPNGEWLGLNGQPEYIKKACEQSLLNLGTESIDLYYMHRQDPDVEIETIVGAMAELVQTRKSKIHWFIRSKCRNHPQSAQSTSNYSNSK
jgi:aryl-alcohol dehydrogenase-like predicted oxidoreductase